MPAWCRLLSPKYRNYLSLDINKAALCDNLRGRGVQSTDISLVCVGTPSQANGALDLTYMRRVCEEIGSALRDKKSNHLVVFRSTMLPGTSEDLLIPILETRSGKKSGVGFDVATTLSSCGREVLCTIFTTPKIVVGERETRTGEVLCQLYSGIDAP